VRIGDGRSNLPGVGVLQRHRDAGEHTARGIGDDAREIEACDVGARRRRRNQQTEEECNKAEARPEHGLALYGLSSQLSTADQRASSATYRCGYSGPMYSARGRIRRLLAYCSSTCAVQPEMRLTAKIGVKRSMAIPSAWYVDAE